MPAKFLWLRTESAYWFVSGLLFSDSPLSKIVGRLPPVLGSWVIGPNSWKALDMGIESELVRWTLGLLLGVSPESNFGPAKEAKDSRRSRESRSKAILVVWGNRTLALCLIARMSGLTMSSITVGLFSPLRPILVDGWGFDVLPLP